MDLASGACGSRLFGHWLQAEKHGIRGRFDRHGNPDDLDAYAANLEAPARAAWQKPDEVVRALGLRPGQTACDVGA